MNKVFKVIWSEARNAYVVVSEIAKNHGSKSCSTKKLLTMLIATGVMTCASMAPAMAGNPAPDDKNIAIGSGASTNTYNYNNVYGDKPITGDIAIGQKAYAWNGGYNEGQDIYIGTHEYYMDFGQGGIVLDHSTWRKAYYKVVDGSKVAGSIAIGKNSVARTGSTILGDHTYNGKIGDTEIKSNTNYMNIQPAVFSTTIGSNTYNAGTLATVTGAFSIASSQFNGSGNTNTVTYGAQNTGATIYGSMNSIESATSNDWKTKGYSGVASSVLGFANRTQNANAALIWGTGNEITNSIEVVTGVDFSKWNSMSVSEAQKDAIKAMQSNQYAGGSVMAIGGNKADYATYSELTGVQNTVTGTKAKAAKYDLVNGYQNTVTNASDVTVIGIKNEVTADGNKVIGDNQKVSGKDNVIFGSADKVTETTVNNAVVLGHNAKVTGEGGVALGAGSVADRANAVSVGSKDANRQIINVAAGTADTDAVNVSQLKEAVAAGDTDVHIKAGEYKVDDKNKVDMNLVDKDGKSQGTVTIAGVAKTEDVAVVYDKNKTSLRSTNAGVAENAIALGQKASAVANSVAIGNGASVVAGSNGVSGVALGNKAHAGYKGTSLGSNAISGREGTTLVGANTNSGSLYTTVVGTDSVINSDGTTYKVSLMGIKKELNVQGAAATVVGSKNTVDNKNGKVYSGVANNVMGSANTIEASNGVTIQGIGNKVTDAYKDMNIGIWEAYDIGKGDYSALAKKESGAVAVVGGANTVSKQTDSTVIGYDNKLTGDKEKGSQNVFMAGSHNELNNVSDSLVMGNKNAITGVSNVISFGYQNAISSDNAVAIGSYASVSAEGGVALGVGSVADRGAGEVGYDPATGAAYDIENGDAPDYVWKAAKGAVSVGSGRETRQITNVAAGTEDTDAVNVAQLKKVNEEALKHSTVTAGDNITVVTEGLNADGGKEYKVALNNDIHLFGDNDAMVSISGSKGTIWASGSVTAGSVVAGDVVMDSTTATVSGLGNKTTAYDGFANGKGKAATEEQLKEVATEAGKHTQVKAGTNVSVVPGETEDGTHVYTVNADGTTVSGDSNVVVTAGEKDANNVTNYGVKLNKDLKGIESVSNGSASLKLSSIPFLGATAELTNGQASVSLMGGSTKINGKVEVRQDGTIGGVTAGRVDNDAVNYGQLKNISAAATAAKTEIKGGTNIANVDQTTADDGHMVYTVNADGTTVSGDSNVVVTAGEKDANNVTNYGVKLNKDLKGIESVSNGSAKLELSSHPIFGATAKLTNGKASVELRDSTTIINGKVQVRQDGSIGGVTAGRVDNDAVNVSQLKDVKAEALKHTTLSDGKNTTVESTVKDGQTDYKVNVAGDLTDITSVANGGAKLTLGAMGGMVSEFANGQGASVKLFGDTAIINGKVTVYKDGRIAGVAAGTADTDAVNVSQLKKVSDTANAGWTLSTNGNATAGTNVTPGALVDFSGDNNVSVSNEGTAVSVKLNKNLKDIETISNGGATLTLGAMGGMVSEFTNGQGASVKLFGDTTTINGKVNVYKDGRIAGVAAGVNNNDAVNVGQLKKVEETAGNANKGWNLSTNGVATEATNVKPGETVDFSGDKNISVSNDGTAVSVKLNKNLKDIETISNGGATLTLGAMGGMVAELANGQGASVKLFGDTTTINGKVNVYKDGRIAGVADGVNANDAVNVSQLQKAAAASAATVTDGVNTTVTTTTAEDGHVDYKVNLNKNLTGVESISNGGASLTMNGFATELANGQGASVKLFGDTTTINGKVNVYKDGRIAGVADGVNATDAVNVSQLQKAAAASATTVSDGVNTTVTATKAEDGHTDYKVNLNKDLVGIESISNAGASLTMNGIATELANGQGASVKLFGDTTTINNAVTVYKDGRISGVADGINNNDAVNVGQLNKVSEIANKGWNLATNGVATEATNVKPGDYVDFSGDKNISISHDGTKVKVELNKDIDVNSVQTNALNSKYNLSVGTMAENGIMPFFVNSTGAFYAAHNKFSVDKDGNMNANSVQTNALNSKYNLSVGTANENGTVPFFVNSNGAFYAANNNFSVDKDGKVIATAGEIGNVVLNNGVYTGHSALRDGELFVGDASGNYSQITTKGAKLGKVTIAEDGKISGVAAGEVSSTSTDAINGSQLHQTNENVAALDKRVTQNEADIATNKANIAQNAADIAANKANIAQNAADIATNKANIAQNAADIAQNKADIAQNKADIAQNKADIAQNKADIAQNKTDIKNLDNRVTNVEELAKKHTTVTAGDNITVTEDTNKDGGKEYKVALDKDIKLDSVTTGQTVMNNDGLKVGDKVSVTATAVTAGKTSISDEGVKVGDKTYISDKGLNANDQKVTNVAAGEISATSKDAVNGSQLYATNQEVANNTNRINQLGSRVNKVGAGAAALAALHPMDFDPDDKLTFSAGYGNYGGENAAAIGAYYRPDEKVMFSVGGTVGNGENMVNAGVSFSLDRTNHVSNSRTAMAREILDLRAEVTELKAMVAKGGLGSIAEDKMKIFPDVAENHWAYEYVGKLAAAGIIEGYPDGKFSGDRMMSRYEFAAMLYRAMQKGAQLDSKIINEFAPEMGRIRVDRISGEDGDRDKIERVRVNAVKGERDHYGNKIAKAEAKAK